MLWSTRDLKLKVLGVLRMFKHWGGLGFKQFRGEGCLQRILSTHIGDGTLKMGVYLSLSVQGLK